MLPKRAEELVVIAFTALFCYRSWLTYTNQWEIPADVSGSAFFLD